MKHRATIHTVARVVEIARTCATKLPDGRYVPARPHCWPVNRFKAMWLIWTGRADLLVWEQQP